MKPLLIFPLILTLALAGCATRNGVLMYNFEAQAYDNQQALQQRDLDNRDRFIARGKKFCLENYQLDAQAQCRERAMDRVMAIDAQDAQRRQQQDQLQMTRMQSFRFIQPIQTQQPYMVQPYIMQPPHMQSPQHTNCNSNFAGGFNCTTR